MLVAVCVVLIIVVVVVVVKVLSSIVTVVVSIAIVGVHASVHAWLLEVGTTTLIAVVAGASLLLTLLKLDESAHLLAHLVLVTLLLVLAHQGNVLARHQAGGSGGC